MFMCTYVYVYVGTQQPYTRNTDLIVKLDWWTAMSPQKFGQCSIRPQGSCRKVRSSKLPFVFSYDRARIRFTDSVDIVPHYHGIPQQILRLVFSKDPDQQMTDAKFEELARFNCTALLSPGALLFPRSTRSCKSRSWILKRTWSTDAVSTTINSAIQTCHGSTEFGSIRPLLKNSRRSKLNQETQKQRNHTVMPWNWLW